MGKIFHFLIFIASISLFSCTENLCREQPDISAVQVELKIQRLDQELFVCESKAEIQAFLNKNRDFAQDILNVSQYPHDSILVAELFRLTQDPYLDTLYNDVQKQFGDLSVLKNELELAFRNIKFYYPSFVVPKIKTIITGFSNDIFVTDSVIYLGLDFFVGEKAHYRPEGISGYLLKRYRPDYISPTVVMMVSNKYNTIDPMEKSLLAEMVFRGKTYFFMEKILPCLPDSMIMGYSPKEIMIVKKNQERLWAYFIEKQLLYKTEHFLKNKYVGERPYTSEIGEKVPPRVASWLGWQIVRKYAIEKNASLNDVMNRKNAAEVFGGSRYKPENE